MDAGPAGEEHEGEGDCHGDTEAQPDHVWGELSLGHWGTPCQLGTPFKHNLGGASQLLIQETCQTDL